MKICDLCLREVKDLVFIQNCYRKSIDAGEICEKCENALENALKRLRERVQTEKDKAENSVLKYLANKLRKSHD